MKSIILASKSPRRKKLLQQINLPFRVEPSSVDESFDHNEPPRNIVQQLSLRKARQVARGKKEVLVIGADTIVLFEDTILEKPGSSEEAMEMLGLLRGRTHEVLTGVALVRNGDGGHSAESCTFVEKTAVRFGKPGDHEIRRYVETGSPMDKAGGYGIQDDWGALFVEGIEGDYNTVVGFPLYAFYQQMKVFAPEYLSHKQ